MSIYLSASAAAAPASVPTSCPQFTNNATSQALDRGAAAGDARAAFCLAVGLHSLDGGELEDALVALGQYGDRQPAELLQLAHRGTLSRQSLADAVTMLPLSLSDDLRVQERAMEVRRAQFKKVAEPALVAEQEFVLQSIGSALADIMAQMPNR